MKLAGSLIAARGSPGFKFRFEGKPFWLRFLLCYLPQFLLVNAEREGHLNFLSPSPVNSLIIKPNTFSPLLMKVVHLFMLGVKFGFNKTWGQNYVNNTQLGQYWNAVYVNFCCNKCWLYDCLNISFTVIFLCVCMFMTCSTSYCLVTLKDYGMHMCVCVYVCVCVRARAYVCVYVFVIHACNKWCVCESSLL